MQRRTSTGKLRHVARTSAAELTAARRVPTALASVPDAMPGIALTILTMRSQSSPSGATQRSTTAARLTGSSG